MDIVLIYFAMFFYLPAGYSQSVDEVVYAVCSKIKISDDFLFTFIAFIVILRFVVL